MFVCCNRNPVFRHWWLFTGVVTRVTQRVSLVEQELPTLENVMCMLANFLIHRKNRGTCTHLSYFLTPKQLVSYGNAQWALDPCLGALMHTIQMLGRESESYTVFEKRESTVLEAITSSLICRVGQGYWQHKHSIPFIIINISVYI